MWKKLETFFHSVENFRYQSAAYDEASVRQEFLNPLFRALGWDIENKLGRIPQHQRTGGEFALPSDRR